MKTPQGLRNLVGMAPRGFGCPLRASALPGRGLEVDVGGASAEPGRGLGPGRGAGRGLGRAWAGPGAWAGCWAGPGAWSEPGAWSLEEALGGQLVGPREKPVHFLSPQGWEGGLAEAFSGVSRFQDSEKLQVTGRG